MKITSLFRMDGWKNIMTGYGMMKDKSAGRNSVPGFTRLTQIELQALYYSGGVISNAVDIPAEAMTQDGFEVQGDDGRLYSAFENLNGHEQFTQALKWTRLLSGALIVMDVAGGGKWEEPWQPEKGGEIRSLRVYSSERICLGMMELNNMPESPYFEDYERFVVKKANGNTFKIHASRCLLFKSATIVDKALPGWLEYETYWGLSSLYKGLEDARNYGATCQGIAHLMGECSVGKYKLSNLEQLVAESNYKAIDNRLEAMDLQKSVINGVFLGEGEDYTKENVTFAGVADVWDRQMMSVSGSYRIPVTKLFGRSAAGMNATGEGDEDNYNKYIQGLQKTQMLPPLKKLLTCLNASLKVIKSEDNKLSPIVVDFNALTKRDQKKDAEVREIMSRTDKNYVDAGILPPEEIIKNRFMGGFTIDTVVDEDFVPDLSGGTEE